CLIGCVYVFCFFCVFFFFQAEDGIRDDLVTGVQTCALPISTAPRPCHSSIAGQKIGIERPRVRSTSGKGEVPLEVYGLAQRDDRSEERRVGKEWRARRWP